MIKILTAVALAGASVFLVAGTASAAPTDQPPSGSGSLSSTTVQVGISPNDPLFYLHHAFVDLIWTEWQVENPRL
jgi:Common central domain of tyrosinase